MRLGIIQNVQVVPNSNGLITTSIPLATIVQPSQYVKPISTELIKPLGDPVPGQTYTAYVKDAAGNSLKIGWLFLDKDGNAISQDFFSDGTFHFTVPDYNYESIFIEIYSTDKYLPVVKTFKELVANPNVILESKTKAAGLSTEATLSLLGVGIAVLALTKKKRKIGSTYIERYKKQPTGTKVLLVGGAAAVLYLILKYKPTAEQKAYLASAKSMLDLLAADYGIVPSLTKGQFSSMVTTIVRAVDKCGSDEGSIYRVFESLNNEADLYQLILSYNIATYDGCFEGSLPFWKVHYTLSESLQSDLSSYELQHINSILADKGINFSF